MTHRSIAALIADRPCITIKRGASVTQACQRMAEAQVRAVAVLDEIGLCGILSERAVIRRCDAQGAPAEHMCVDAVMTANPATIGSDQSPADAFRVMKSGGVRHLPVVDRDGRLTGVVSLRDIPKEDRFEAQPVRYAAE